MSQTIHITLVKESCLYCHAVFGMAQHAMDRMRRDHGKFWCPYCGGSMVYKGETEEHSSPKTRVR